MVAVQKTKNDPLDGKVIIHQHDLQEVGGKKNTSPAGFEIFLSL